MPSPSSPHRRRRVSSGIRLRSGSPRSPPVPIAGLAGWWVASAPAVRIGVELAETRQALQQEKDKVQNLGAALAATWRELGDRAVASADKAAAQNQERDALQQALQQSEAAAATFAQSLAQERDRNQQLEQQLATRRDAVPEPVSPAAEPTSDKPPTEKADPDLLRLMARASLLSSGRHRRGAHRAGTRGRIRQRSGAVRVGRDIRPGRPVSLGNRGHARRRGAGRRPLCQGVGRRRRRGEGSIGDVTTIKRRVCRED